MKDKAYKYLTMYLLSISLIFTSCISSFTVHAEDLSKTQKDNEEVVEVEVEVEVTQEPSEIEGGGVSK